MAYPAVQEQAPVTRTDSEAERDEKEKPQGDEEQVQTDIQVAPDTRPENEDFSYAGLARKETVGDAMGGLTGLNKRRGKDSESYSRVISAGEAVKRKYNITLSNESETAEVQMEGISDTYTELIKACEAYLKSHAGFRWTNVGKKRVDAIELILTCAREEWKLAENNKANTALMGGTFEQFLVEAAIKSSDSALDELLEIKGGASAAAEPMTLDGFRTLASKDVRSKNKDIPKNMDAVLALLEIYHQFMQSNSPKSARPILMQIIVLCSAAKIPPKGQSPAQTAMLKLYQQSVEKYYAMPKETKEDNESIETTRTDGQTLKEEESGTISDGTFSDYPLLPESTARQMAASNLINKGKKDENSHGGLIYSGGGYIKAPENFKGFNEYVRAKANAQRNKKGHHGNTDHEKLMTSMDTATESGTLPQKTRFFRMLGKPYLQHALGIKDAKLNGISLDTAKTINKMAGTIITDDSYMSVGYRVDKVFEGSPVMLTLLCDEDTTLFPSDNFDETEFIFPRNTSYMIMGAAVKRGKEFEKSIYTAGGRLQGQKARTMIFDGLEIFAKVIKK